MKRKASALWKGAGKTGKGYLTTPTKVLNDTPYSFTSRFEEGTGTNPEELIAAAHAGCFNMALAFMLNEKGFEANTLETTATVTMERKDNSWSVSHIALDLNADVAEIDNETFENITQSAKTNCPVSKLLNTTIELNARLKS